LIASLANYLPFSLCPVVQADLLQRLSEGKKRDIDAELQKEKNNLEKLMQQVPALLLCPLMYLIDLFLDFVQGHCYSRRRC
jgi:hypothetical protein